MSTARFDPDLGLIVVLTEVVGPSGSALLQFAVDTGSTGTLINVGLLVALGYDPAMAPDRIQITTGSGIEFVPRVQVESFRAIGQQRSDFPVLAHTLPPSAGVDGLLGVDFFQDSILGIDFRYGIITVEN